MELGTPELVRLLKSLKPGIASILYVQRFDTDNIEELAKTGLPIINIIKHLIPEECAKSLKLTNATGNFASKKSLNINFLKRILQAKEKKIKNFFVHSKRKQENRLNPTRRQTQFPKQANIQVSIKIT